MSPPSNKIINGLVYRHNKQIMFISLYDEKRREIYEEQYLIFGDKDEPIPEDCFILVEFTEIHHRIITTPIILINLHNQGERVLARQISIDGLVSAAYDAAIKYLAKVKTEASRSEA